MPRTLPRRVRPLRRAPYSEFPTKMGLGGWLASRLKFSISEGDLSEIF